MNKPHGIIVFGANGSGKTTLRREFSYCCQMSDLNVLLDRHWK